MASSPPAPFPANLPNPKKRPSVSSQVSIASNKRPKLHPLRQTSFAADSDANASAIVSARSETGSMANSQFSTMSASKAQPRGRGRPRKSVQVTDEEAGAARDNRSTTGAGPSQAKSQVSAARSGVGNAEEEEIEDEDDEEDEDHEGDDTETARQKQVESNRNLFLAQLPPTQSLRYNYFRQSRFKDAIVKRIVNQTVSQSVGGPAINAVQHFTKAFAIEIIERAREVQTEYATAADTGIEELRRSRWQKVEQKEQALAEKERTAVEQIPSSTMPEQEKRALQLEIARLREEAEKHIPNKHKGGLLPDHLREALRRYKADGEGNGFGFDGLSHPLLGVKGSHAWQMGDGATGRRMFR